MKIYVSGPMSGIENHNYPLFNCVSEELRARGFNVVNPAELDELIEPGTKPWEWYLRRDLAAMLTCDSVALLPNWRMSRGARLEVTVAHSVKMDIYEIDIENYVLNSTKLNVNELNAVPETATVE